MGRIKPGELIPSEVTLAREFVLSRHTVRKAISVLVNQGFLYTEHGRGTYCQDRSSEKHDSKIIGVITTYISEYIFPRVIQGIDSVLSENSYSIMLKNSDNNKDKEALCLQEVVERNIDGLIIEPARSAVISSHLKYYDALDAHNIPYIFIHGYHQQLENRSYLLLDDRKGMHMAVAYLTQLGHKNIFGIFKADDIQGVNRHKGYTDALTGAGLTYNPDHVIWYHTDDRDSKPKVTIKQMLESDEKIDAIACYNDQIAFSIFETLNGMGIEVPADISLTGFDDSYFSTNCPVKITTVTHPKEKFGGTAAELLLRLLKDEDYLHNPIQKVIQPELVVKDSCVKR
jgi:GntR family transcriptional regulator of arabinose operon